MRAQYRWAYTLLLVQEIGQNQHEKGGWAYNTSWAYNTYSTVLKYGLNMYVCVLRVRTLTVDGPNIGHSKINCFVRVTQKLEFNYTAAKNLFVMHN